MISRLKGAGGDGGNAISMGDDSEAEGGQGGAAGNGPGDGGKGGDALAIGRRSIAVGGKGGRGGVVPGMPGSDATAYHDDEGAFGGMGGEAPQQDGRGGRGGVPHFDVYGNPVRHIKYPYWIPYDIPGRGGDGQDSPQYTARRLLVELIKSERLQVRPFPLDVWLDRDRVSIEDINGVLTQRGYAWRVRVDDDEYEFFDVDCSSENDDLGRMT